MGLAVVSFQLFLWVREATNLQPWAVGDDAVKFFDSKTRQAWQQRSLTALTREWLQWLARYYPESAAEAEDFWPRPPREGAGGRWRSRTVSLRLEQLWPSGVREQWRQRKEHVAFRPQRAVQAAEQPSGGWESSRVVGGRLRPKGQLARQRRARGGGGGGQQPGDTRGPTPGPAASAGSRGNLNVDGRQLRPWSANRVATGPQVQARQSRRGSSVGCLQKGASAHRMRVVLLRLDHRIARGCYWPYEGSGCSCLRY